MERPRLLLVSAVIAGWLALTGGSQAQDGTVVHVALAGTMEQVISRQIGPAFTPATGYKLDVYSPVIGVAGKPHRLGRADAGRVYQLRRKRHGASHGSGQ